MDEDSGYEIISEEELFPQVEDDHDTAPMDIPFRATTFSDWPPEPPMPADVELAQGTIDESPPRRRAGIYAAVRRPTTSSEPT